MKKLICLFVLTIVSLAAFAQKSLVQQTNKDDFEEMSFEVSVKKDNYLPIEPIFAEFSFTNKTKDLITTDIPNFLQESKVKIYFEGKVIEIEHLGAMSENTEVRFPSSFKPNQIYKKEEMLGPSVGWYLTQPGTYQLQFVLHNSDGTKILKSNLIDIEVKTPQGTDKDAFDFLNKHRDFFGLSSWVSQERKCEDLLKTFVNKYGESVYSELAISTLGSTYLARGEFDKAQVEFEKISSSDNKYIADNAKKSLAEIEMKRASLKKN